MAEVSKDQAAKIANWLASQGRNGDSLLAHVARGEIVIPNILLDAEDQALRKIIQGIFKEYGVDPDIYTVGHEKNSINPETGLIEFGWLSKAWKAITKPIKQVVKTVTKVVSNVAKAVVTPVAKVLAPIVSPKQSAPAVAEAPSTGASASTALANGTVDEVTSGKAKKSAALRRQSRGKRRLRVGNQMSIGTTGTAGVGTGGATGSSVNVPKG